MRQLSLAVVALLVVSGCTQNKQALNASKLNRTRVSQVALGQTFDEVRTAMRKGPESKTMRALPDGLGEETWNYLTDYDNHVNTTIVFTNGRVTEIKTSEWLGDGNFAPHIP